MRRVVFIAAGAPDTAVAELQRLQLSQPGAVLRVVSPPETAAEIERLAESRPGELLLFRPRSLPFLWVKLSVFLVCSFRSEVICLKAPGRFAALKLLAVMLPGRLSFADGALAPRECSRWQLVRSALAGKGPICVVASASPARLEQIVADLRSRYAGAPLHGLIPLGFDVQVSQLFDSCERIGSQWLANYLKLFRRCFGLRRFRLLVLPWTQEKWFALRMRVWLLPRWRVEVYNDNLDAFSGRNLFALARHGYWLMQQRRESRLRVLPVAVVGVASAAYLRELLPALRRRFQEVAVHEIGRASCRERV